MQMSVIKITSRIKLSNECEGFAMCIYNTSFSRLKRHQKYSENEVKEKVKETFCTVHDTNGCSFSLHPDIVEPQYGSIVLLGYPSQCRSHSPRD